eukprot:COSAG01_NODE_1362_length_10565_cov_111.342156_6_plen_102_part_00
MPSSPVPGLSCREIELTDLCNEERSLSSEIGIAIVSLTLALNNGRNDGGGLLLSRAGDRATVIRCCPASCPTCLNGADAGADADADDVIGDGERVRVGGSS